MYAVLRVRGAAGKKEVVKDTLKMLNLTKPNHCVLIPKTPVYEGMLAKVKDFITWGEVSADVKKSLEAKNKDGKVFRLHPPIHGYERGGVRKGFNQGGALGYRGEKINDIIKRMI
ncbi:MAG: uL30 family ribosomal protein [Candidatus Aenigmarchaeota archaeon]|nr:uL30 family ribosomal protein [Candidatus Aenigmarchaeota archaeon]